MFYKVLQIRKNALLKTKMIEIIWLRRNLIKTIKMLKEKRLKAALDVSGLKVFDCTRLEDIWHGRNTVV